MTLAQKDVSFALKYSVEWQGVLSSGTNKADEGITRIKLTPDGKLMRLSNVIDLVNNVSTMQLDAMRLATKLVMNGLGADVVLEPVAADRPESSERNADVREINDRQKFFDVCETNRHTYLFATLVADIKAAFLGVTSNDLLLESVFDAERIGFLVTNVTAVNVLTRT